MTAEITFDDYQKIGMMETALSNHADEAFFELSSEGQKLACKIFRYLTETDRENREIRRAMTVGKLCAATGAEFSEVAAVIETFRREGRTFLMPPPEFKLTENSLVDISHESLIRKWERLKIWVEEEGQSARTYRRLAEDAFLHEQGKVGFWSDPELKDALEWRENFKPNETWAELYGETGEKKYRASFADAMKYLDDSKLDRDKKIAGEKRQRRILFALSVLFFLTTISAVYAYSIAQKNAQEAEKIALQLSLSDEKTKKANESLEVTNDKLKESEKSLLKTNDELENSKNTLIEKNDALEASLANAEKQKKLAESEKNRANEQAELAKLSEAEKQKSLEMQKRLAEDAKTAKDTAVRKQIEAENALGEAKATADREEINRSALVFLEQGEYERALPKFKELLGHYENKTEQMTEESRSDGKWWSLHNLGIVNSKLPKTHSERFRDAECAYKKALNILGENLDVGLCPSIQSQNSSRYIQQTVSYKIDDKADRSDEIMRSKVTTLRRLAQFYRERAVNSTDEREAARLNESAIENYDKLLEILPKETYYGKDKIYPADVYVELADTLADLNGWLNTSQIGKLYNDAIDTYSVKKEFVKEVAVRKKLAEFMINYDFERQGVIELLEETIKIQEDENRMNLPPIDVEVADSYNRLARASEANNSYEIAGFYEKFAKRISDLDFEINKPDGFKVKEFLFLANDYVKVGKCERAKEIFTYGIKQNRIDVNFGQYILSRAAQFHNNVLHDKKEAKKYFDEFYKEFKRNPENLFAFEYIDDYEQAGDFYLAQAEYAKANELYEYGLRINAELILLFESLIYQKGETEKSKYDLKVEQNAAKSRNIELITKIGNVFAAQNQWQEAETKYAEVAKLMLGFDFTSPETIGISAVKVLLSQGDIYERAGKEEKAKENYKKAERILGIYVRTNFRPPGTNKEGIALKIQLLKKLGDFNRIDRKVAVDYYYSAIGLLRQIDKNVSQTQVKEDYPPYIINGKPTAEFYTDKAELLEALMSLNAVEVTDGLKAELNNAQSKAKELKTMEEKSPCEQ